MNYDTDLSYRTLKSNTSKYLSYDEEEWDSRSVRSSFSNCSNLSASIRVLDSADSEQVEMSIEYESDNELQRDLSFDADEKLLYTHSNDKDNDEKPKRERLTVLEKSFDTIPIKTVNSFMSSSPKGRNYSSDIFSSDLIKTSSKRSKLGDKPSFKVRIVEQKEDVEGEIVLSKTNSFSDDIRIYTNTDLETSMPSHVIPSFDDNDHSEMLKRATVIMSDTESTDSEDLTEMSSMTEQVESTEEDYAPNESKSFENAENDHNPKESALVKEAEEQHNLNESKSENGSTFIGKSSPKRSISKKIVQTHGRDKTGGVFLLIVAHVALLIYFMLQFHWEITKPLQIGDVLPPGKWKSKCGLIQTNNCRPAYIEMEEDGVLSIVEEGVVTLSLVGKVCKEGNSKCIPGAKIISDGKFEIGGVVTKLDKTKLKYPLDWAFEDNPF